YPGRATFVARSVFEKTRIMNVRAFAVMAVLLAAIISAPAQVVLDQANSAPVVGDVYIRVNGGIIFDVPPLPGMPPVYDYGAEVPVGAPDTVKFTDPLAGEWCSGWIPGADVELCDGWAGPDGNGRYYTPTPTGLVLMGAFDDAAYLFADQKLDMPYPCQAGTTWSDTYAGADQWGTDRQIYGTIDGLAVTECDVMTPNGAYTGALRVETTTIQDRHDNGSFFSHMEHSLIAYYVPGIHLPVLWIHNASYDDIQGTQFDLSGGFWLQDAISTGVGEVEQHDGAHLGTLSWDPKTHAFLASDLAEGAHDYRILDALGRCARSGRVSGPAARIPTGPGIGGVLVCQVLDSEGRGPILRVAFP
ncbi:MAG: hypothetical protein KDB88_01740, partial [Flavobacteriales bacterium]|nr:hypothetical protein [Flavobacteriales bacterium]